VHVIDQGISKVSGGKHAGELGLPDTLREPGAGRNPAEVLFEISVETRDLLALILRGNRDQDGFVEASADKLDLAVLDQLSQAVEILGPMFLDPGEERAGIVEAETNARMLFELYDEREIGGFIGFFENMFEIAAGLVRVDEQSEMKIWGHGDCFFSLPMITRRAIL